ncbi:MAG TPA: prepilin peptidase [Polyangiaceae bacterium]|nr:prepilin peptidase [Polyangiaceae bacterium]
METVFLDLLPNSLVLGLGVVFGLLCGSFLNVVIYRLPRGLSLAYPGSQCPHCGTKIAPYDNVPVLAYLWLAGRSRCCHQKISVRYPLVELIGGLAAGAVVTMKLLPYRHELTLLQAGGLFWLYLALALGLIAAAAIDLEHMILPDSLTWGGMLLGLLSSPLRSEVTLIESALGAALGFVGLWFLFIWLHQKLRGFPGMGLGDAKLMALAGAWFGPWGALLTLFGGALQGTLVTAATLLWHGKITEPRAVTAQREELLAAIESAEGDAKQALLQELHADPLGLPPDEAPGGARVAFGPFLVLTLLELLFFYEPLRSLVRAQFLL